MNMLDQLNQGGVNTNEAHYKALQKNKAELEKIKKKMEQSGVMVHICRLRNSESNPSKQPLGRHGRRNWHKTSYANIYVHAKLTIFDDAYLTLGSANWNHRSMFTDTELNIAVQYHDDKATDFRQNIWAKHLNGLWSPMISGVKSYPEDWYSDWEKYLRDNFQLYTAEEALNMNLFPYYEDLQKVKESGIINSQKQGNT